MKSIIGLLIFATVLLNSATSASAQNYYAKNNTGYNYTAHHETPRQDYDRDGDRNRYNDYSADVFRDRERLACLTAHIQQDKIEMLNKVNRGNYRSAQREAFDIMHDQQERNAMLDHLYFDGYNWQADHSRMNAYSDRTQRDVFLNDINHDENELVKALVNGDFYAAQQITEHINRDTYHAGQGSYRDGRRENHEWNNDGHRN